MERSAQKMPRLPELQEMDSFTPKLQVKSSLISFFSELTCETASKRVSRPFCRFVMILKVVR